MTGPFSCGRARAALSPWLDGRLPATEREAVEAHLAGCPACAREAREMRAGDAAARAAFPAAPASPDFLPGLDRKIARGIAPHAAGRMGLARLAAALRAALPIAAGLALGAGGTFLAARAMRALPDLPAASADEAVGRFAAASDAFLTDAVHHCGEDPVRDVELLRRETQALGLPEAIREVRRTLPAIRESDPSLARSLELATEGTERILARIAAGAGHSPGRTLVSVWDDEERMDLHALVRGLSRGGVPRPPARASDGGGDSPGPAAGEPDSVYLAGLGHYSRGRIAPARECWERIVVRPPDRRWASRAGYWASRTYVLEGRVGEAMEALGPVTLWCPEAVRESALGTALYFELLDLGGSDGPAAGPGDRGPVTLFQSGGEGGNAPSIRVQAGSLTFRLRHPGLEEIRRELLESVGPLLAPAPAPAAPSRESVRLEEVLSIRVDGRDVALPDAETRDSLRALAGFLAQRLRSQGRCRVERGEGGATTLALDLSPRGDERCRFHSPQARRLAAIVAEARGGPLHDAEGYSLVSRMEVSGRAAPVPTRGPDRR